MTEEKMDLYILTGFLGAGKTTVLMRVLSLLGEKRVGVIRNEFRNHPTMEGLVLRQDEIELVRLEQGGLFCACRQDYFQQALEEMGRYDLDCLFVELSGLADPAELEDTLQAAGKAGDRFVRKGVICLIDAQNFIQQSKDVELVQLQLKHCNLAVINKADLVSPELLVALQQQVRRINPNCEVVSCSYGQFNLDFMEKDLLAHPWADPERSLRMGSHTLFLNCRQPVAREGLRRFLDRVKGDTYRIKGFFLLEEGWQQVDVVGDKVEFRPCLPSALSQLVLISRVGSAIVGPLEDSWRETVGAPMELKD